VTGYMALVARPNRPATRNLDAQTSDPAGDNGQNRVAARARRITDEPVAARPKRAGDHPLLRLQRQLGNRYIQRIVSTALAKGASAGTAAVQRQPTPASAIEAADASGVNRARVPVVVT